MLAVTGVTLITLSSVELSRKFGERMHCLTEGLRHFVKMNVVGTRRKPSERYLKDGAKRRPSMAGMGEFPGGILGLNIKGGVFV